ncbi:hypothetical protein Leryth_002946 [Lithospermum erythrorhizon]|nr:hypothetical protein Leryth_002946 [Lithospermum erythrorhizon]
MRIDKKLFANIFVLMIFLNIAIGMGEEYSIHNTDYEGGGCCFSWTCDNDCKMRYGSDTRSQCVSILFIGNCFCFIQDSHLL